MEAQENPDIFCEKGNITANKVLLLSSRGIPTELLLLSQCSDISKNALQSLCKCQGQPLRLHNGPCAGL